MPDHAVADRLDSDDSVEVVRVGKKRGAASPAPSAPARKKLADGKGESLPVLRLDLGFVPPEELDDALKIVLGEHGRGLLEEGGGDASLPLCEIVFQHVRDDAKSPHRLYIRRADTNAALVELDPVDPMCAVAQSWVSWIAPPPLTKSQSDVLFLRLSLLAAQLLTRARSAGTSAVAIRTPRSSSFPTGKKRSAFSWKRSRATACATSASKGSTARARRKAS